MAATLDGPAGNREVEVQERQYSATEHLARTLLLGRFRWDIRMAMYSAHFDESGHRADSDHLVVAGGLASVDQWVHLEREWRNVLAPFGTSIFHAVDFEHRKPPYERLSDKEALEVSLRLAGIIRRRLEAVISCCVDMRHYRAMNAKWLVKECYGAPYPFAARSCIGGVEEWCKRHSVAISEVRLFFEDGAPDNGQLLWIAERDQIPTPVFQKKHELLPLQCGDFVSWHFLQLLKGSDKHGRSESVMRQIGNAHVSRTMDLSDPDRLPAILEIPPRDPRYVYVSKIIRKSGVRRAVVHSWPKGRPGEQKLDRRTLDLPDRRIKTPQEIDRAMNDYDANRRER